mmetsp:Transcript_13690/g.31827  ORF Transcript_13690/g.31827 Transcript_13690/m.31827 type:complete len:118 (-) Transcript_13690:328-681(-)
MASSEFLKIRSQETFGNGISQKDNIRLLGGVFGQPDIAIMRLPPCLLLLLSSIGTRNQGGMTRTTATGLQTTTQSTGSKQTTTTRQASPSFRKGTVSQALHKYIPCKLTTFSQKSMV